MSCLCYISRLFDTTYSMSKHLSVGKDSYHSSMYLKVFKFKSFCFLIISLLPLLLLQIHSVYHFYEYIYFKWSVQFEFYH